MHLGKKGLSAHARPLTCADRLAGSGKVRFSGSIACQRGGRATGQVCCVFLEGHVLPKDLEEVTFKNIFKDMVFVGEELSMA